MPTMPRKKGPPTALRIDTPNVTPQIALVSDQSPVSSAFNSAVSENDSSFSLSNLPPSKPSSVRNMKGLSLNLSAAQSSVSTIPLPAIAEPSPAPTQTVFKQRPRRPSVISLPSTANVTSTLKHRKEEEGSPTVPYEDGPIQILPGIWLGSEENARDWKCLMERGIRSILNVAKEVNSPFDAIQPTRRFVSTPNLKHSLSQPVSTLYPAHLASGRPSMNYLKLQWSHGQQDLVEQGFPAAMSFVDSALERNDGVLIHCQCGISRSATMVIALVMRAASQKSSQVPPEVWDLKGYQGAYSFVKEKSKWVGPNMSLIYQLLDFERSLKPVNHSSVTSEASSAADEEEEWGRRRQMMEEDDSDDRQSSAIIREAQALDKAMEERIINRKTSVSSIASSGVGMGPAWRSRYGGGRKRTGSINSNMTSNSILSEDLVEEDEEQELLGVGGGFDDSSVRHRSSSFGGASTDHSPDVEMGEKPAELFPPLTARTQVPNRPPPSAPSWKTSFNVPPPPATASRATFEIVSKPPVSKATAKPVKRRPPPIGILPPVPDSPVTLIAEPVVAPDAPRVRLRTESRKPAPPPLHLRNSLKVPFTPKHKKSNSVVSMSVATPSQTLFVFPPESTVTARTPSTMMLTTHFGSSSSRAGEAGSVPFPAISTPRVSTFKKHGRTRSFIDVGLNGPPTATTACSIVDARGWVGLD